MTDMDVVRWSYESRVEGQRFDDSTILKSFKGTEYNPFIINKVQMILFDKFKRI